MSNNKSLGWLLNAAQELDRSSHSDRDLLHEFAVRGDESAFEVLVKRHSSMVLGVCTRCLPNGQDAEDACQAVFLILAKKAKSQRWHASIANWLYAAARQVSRNVNRAARRAARRNIAGTIFRGRGIPKPVSLLDQMSARELLTALDDELERLPAIYREPLILYHFEDLSRSEAAARLGVGLDTLKTRLERGRKRLAAALANRGVDLSAAFIAIAATSPATSGSPPLVRSILTNVTQKPATAIAQAVAMYQTAKLLPLTAAVLLAAGLTGVGAALMLPGTSPPGPQADSTKSADSAPEAALKPQQPRIDCFGDPLPDNAIARLGSLRFCHGETVDQVTISADGRWIVSTARDGNCFWEALTGRELPLEAGLKRAHVFTVNGKLVAAERAKGCLRLWDVAAGKKMGELPVDLSDSLFGLSPDGRTLVWWAFDPVRPLLQFCDVVTGKVADPIELQADEKILYFAFSADSKILLTGHDTQSLHVWDLRNRKKLRSTPAEGLRNSGMKIALAPDGSVVAVASSGKPIRLLDVRTLKELPPLLDQQQQHVNALAFSADSKRLAVNYPSKTVHVWDLETRGFRRLEGNGSQVFGTAFSADGKILVGGDGQSVTIWDLATAKVRPCCELGHTYCVHAISFSIDGASLVSGAGNTDSTIHVWDPRSGQEKERWTGHAAGVEALVHSPDGRLVASGSEDQTIRLWDAAAGKELRRIEPRDGMVWALAFAPDGKTLASSGGNKDVRLWDVESGRESSSFGDSGNGAAELAFSPDGKTLVAKGIKDSFLRLWSDPKQLPRSKKRARCLHFSPDGRLLARSEADGTIRLQDLATGEDLWSLALNLQKDSPPAARVGAIAFSPDGRCLAAGYTDRTVRLWELASSQVRACFQGHRGGIVSTVFSPDGALLASGSWDRTVMVWNVTGRITAGGPFPAGLNSGEGNTLWNDLASSDAATAFRAMQRLSSAGQAGVSFLKDRLQSAVDGKQINQLIAALDSDQLGVRQRASQELEKMGDIVAPALLQALAGKPSAEVRQSLERIHENVVRVGASERLRDVRAVEVLEQIGSAQARGVMESLSKGVPEARLTKEAMAALARLRK